MKKFTFIIILFCASTSWLFCQNKRFITFYATREGIVGHAFVSFVKEDPVQKMTILEGCWGFYPKNVIPGGSSYMIGEVQGQIRDDYATQRDAGYTVEISSSEYENALKIKNKWATANYELTVKDCISFVTEVAKSLESKLNLPLRSTFDLPHDYIEELKLINSSNKICPLHPDIVTLYSKDKPNYHFYTFNDLICDYKDNACCTKEFVFKIMKSNVGYTAPSGGSSAVIDCNEVSLPILGSIVTKIESNSLSITNFTKSNHLLHEGKVVRYVVEVGTKVYVYTVGVGNNKDSFRAWLNQNNTTVNIIWGGVNKKLKDEVQKQLYEKKKNGECGTSASTLFLFDLSGSMNGNGVNSNISKLQQAKNASKQTLSALKNNNSGITNEVAVLGFSGGCAPDPTTVISNFETDLSLVESRIDAMGAGGGTPLAEAIAASECKLANHLAQTGQDKGKLIVLSDGQATCQRIRPPGTYNSGQLGQTVIDVSANQCGSSNYKIKYYTIGFNIAAGSPAERDLQYLSQISGGKYLNVQSQTQLERAFKKFNRTYIPKQSPFSNSLPSTSLSKFDDGVNQINAESFSPALKTYEDFSKLHPDDCHGAYNLALMQEANDFYKNAIFNYQKYLSLCPNSSDKEFVEKQIIFLEEEFREFLLFQKEVVKSDLEYLKLHFEKIQNGQSIALAEEFKGFLKEKGGYYMNLPELMGKSSDRLFKKNCQEVASGLDNCAKTINRNPSTWDRDATPSLSMTYLNLERLLESF